MPLLVMYMKLPKIFNKKPSSERNMKPKPKDELEPHHKNKLDLLSLPEEERIRLCREIRGILQQKISERKAENLMAF